MNFTEIFSRYVDETGLKTGEAAELVGVSRHMASRYLNGDSVPSFNRAIEIIRKMGKDVMVFSGTFTTMHFSNGYEVLPVEKMTAAKYRNDANYYMYESLNKKSGFHRDHIVPVAFCRLLRISPEQASHADNLRYLSPEKNKKKGNFITKSGYEHLKAMCVVWGIPVPSDDFIRDYNKRAKSFAK